VGLDPFDLICIVAGGFNIGACVVLQEWYGLGGWLAALILTLYYTHQLRGVSIGTLKDEED
jgi:hypothetical protein